MATAVDLLVRMLHFEDYTILLCHMLRRWFPETCDWAYGRFLAAAEAALDVGVGLVLHRMAWRKGGELAASRWLMGKAVQELVDEIIERLFVTSIEVERRHAEVKMWNPARKLAHIATVSRNAIILRFSRWREQQCLALERAAEATRRAKRTTWTALAWKAASETECPVGQRSTSCMDDASPAAVGTELTVTISK